MVYTNLFVLIPAAVLIVMSFVIVFCIFSRVCVSLPLYVAPVGIFGAQRRVGLSCNRSIKVIVSCGKCVLIKPLQLWQRALMQSVRLSSHLAKQQR